MERSRKCMVHNVLNKFHIYFEWISDTFFLYEIIQNNVIGQNNMVWNGMTMVQSGKIMVLGGIDYGTK